ncbi:MAG: A/G-specific adenine glycosylase, partial [Acidimicrobiales bacterium]
AQSRFAGSDRQGRGQLVAALVRGPIEPGRAAAVAGWPNDDGRAARVVASRVDHGLAVLDPTGVLRLPDGR